MGSSTDIVEAVLAVSCQLAGFVREICPGMYQESSKPILMQLLLLLTVMV